MASATISHNHLYPLHQAGAPPCDVTADTRVLTTDEETSLSTSAARLHDPDDTPHDGAASVATCGRRLDTRQPALGPVSGATGARHTTITSHRDAMRHDEIGRVRAFSLLMILVALITLLLIPILGGDAIARTVLIATVISTTVVYGALLWLSRDPDTFDPCRASTVFAIHTLAGHGAAYYFGVFSPIATIMAISLYVFAQGSRRRYALTAYASLAVGQAILASLIISETIADRGLITSEHLDAGQQIAIHLCVQVVLLIALVLGRMGRHSTVKTLRHMEHAVRELAHRDALLHEAKQALERAEREGSGPFTDRVIGSFQLGDVIGRGAMGEIYEAQNIATGETAAVKLLHSDIHYNPRQRARFVREARVAASLSSPHLVEVLEVAGVDAPLPYLAMERLRGRDLGHLLRERGTLSLTEVVDLVAQVSAGLRAMRDAGIVHRDLKPHNIFLVDSGQEPVWKVLDFGISKLSDEQSSLTEGQVVGTPAYMAPEQARGLPVDHRSDLYSLGVIVYRCLTGRSAFSGSQVPHVLYQVAHEMPVRPGDLVSVPEDINAVLAIAMAKKPADRFNDVDELALRLSEAAYGRLAVAVRDRAAALIQRQPWHRKPSPGARSQGRASAAVDQQSPGSRL